MNFIEDFELESRRATSNFESNEETFQIDSVGLVIDESINDLPF